MSTLENGMAIPELRQFARRGPAGSPRWRSPAQQPFNLSRRFAVLAFAAIMLVNLGSSMVLSHFLSREMLQRDAKTMMHMVQSRVAEHDPDAYFTSDAALRASHSAMEAYFNKVAHLPDVLRLQVYNHDGRVLWSNHAQMIDRTFSDNAELEAALRGTLMVEADLIEERRYLKPELVFARLPEKQFVEYYMPIRGQDNRRLVGVVEVYKAPTALFASIQRGLRLIWLCAIGGGLFLFGALFWVVRRGHRLIEAQQRSISGSAGFKAVGEITSAVAQNMRNPLAAIRTAAELICHDQASGSHAMARGITQQVDRLDVWIRSLLDYAHAGSRSSTTICAKDVLRALLEEYSDELAARRIQIVWDLDQTLPNIQADAPLVEQIVGAVVANALDAMPSGGILTIGSRAGQGPSRGGAPQGIEIEVSDTGSGIAAAQLEHDFSHPHSTRARGLGIGLPLIGRTLEHIGGGLETSSTPGKGTSVTICLPFST